VTTPPHRILLADDSLLIRSGVEALLHDEPSISIVGAASSLPELLTEVERLQPDLVITDVRMPPTMSDEGIQAACQLRATFPNMAVLVLSQVADPGFLRRIVDGGSSGRGYLLKDNLATPGELLTAIELVTSGGSFIDSAVVDLLVAQQSQRPQSPLDPLTAREREILAAIAMGKSNHAIGDELFISHRAVEKHINSIFSKLGLFDDPVINRRVQAVLMFLEVSPKSSNIPL
jgi:DNA-binding NarL/FixJ family response regulator